MSSATRKSSAGPGVDLPCIFQGAATPSPRLEIQVPDTVQTKPANQTPQSDHGLVWVASPLNGSRLSSISQQLIQEQPSIEAQQSITNKAGWKSLFHGKAAGIFVKERPSQQRGSKHGATRTTVPAGLCIRNVRVPPSQQGTRMVPPEICSRFPSKKPSTLRGHSRRGTPLPASGAGGTWKETLDMKPWGRCYPPNPNAVHISSPSVGWLRKA